ncbi:MAG: flagellar biosynthesis anti-sigma factor FlgM [Treponemataceae bacterium]
MTIDKLKGINPIEKTSRTRNIQQVGRIDNEDSIRISKESQFLAEAYLAKKVAMEAPDVREDKIAEVRLKLEDPAYISKAIDEIANMLLRTE